MIGTGALHTSTTARELSWHRATVTAVEGERIRLSFHPLRHCQRCLRGEGCGAGVFSRLFSAQGSELWLPAERSFVLGQSVRVGVSERELVRAAALLYGLPLLVFMLAASAAATVFSSALGSDLGALLIGLLAAALALRLAGRWRGRIVNPRVESLSAAAECGSAMPPPANE